MLIVVLVAVVLLTKYLLNSSTVNNTINRRLRHHTQICYLSSVFYLNTLQMWNRQLRQIAQQPTTTKTLQALLIKNIHTTNAIKVISESKYSILFSAVDPPPIFEQEKSQSLIVDKTRRIMSWRIYGIT